MGYRRLLARAVVVSGVVVTQAAGSAALAAEPVTQTFNYTGDRQSFTVPSGVQSLYVQVQGGSGGSGYGGFAGRGGPGTQIFGSMPVVAGQQLWLVVGGGGGNATGRGTGCTSGNDEQVSQGGAGASGIGKPGETGADQGGGKGGRGDRCTGGGGGGGGASSQIQWRRENSNSTLIVAAGGGGGGGTGAFLGYYGGPGGPGGVGAPGGLPGLGPGAGAGGARGGSATGSDRGVSAADLSSGGGGGGGGGGVQHGSPGGGGVGGGGGGGGAGAGTDLIDPSVAGGLFLTQSNAGPTSGGSIQINYTPLSGQGARLLARDPGARVGGITQVADAPGVTLSAAGPSGPAGGPGAGGPTGPTGPAGPAGPAGTTGLLPTNFLMGLGPRERIVGGPGPDQLGARGAGTVVRGGDGNDLIHGHRGRQVLLGESGHDHLLGGPGRDRLDGGPGDDRLVDKQGATMVLTGSGSNQVDVADGEGDERVMCARGSVNRIRADRGDRIHPFCRAGAASSVSYRPSASETAAAVAQDRPVSGAGSSSNPYVAECDDETRDPCVVSSFTARKLKGLWRNEYVPAYRCPGSHPYLLDRRSAPAGASIIRGVEVIGLGPIGVSIVESTGVGLGDVWRATGTETGPDSSVATNWTAATNAYRVRLHCTKTQDRGWGGPR